MHLSGSRRHATLHRRAAASASALTVAVAALLPGNAHAEPRPAPNTGSAQSTNRIDALGDNVDFFDSRESAGAGKALAARSARLSASPSSGVRALRKALGTQGILDIDPLTKTPRTVARLDGFLTGPSGMSARTIALRYVSFHRDAFGLSAADIAGLKLRKDYVDIAGTHHLSFVQSVRGVPVFGNGLKANVAKDGRLINVLGSPVPGVVDAGLGTAKITAEAARLRAASDVKVAPRAATASKPVGAAQATTFSTGDRAQLVVFQSLVGPRLAWQTLSYPDAKRLFLHVVDAANGRVLYRQSLTDSDNGLAWDNRPNAPKGGQQQLRDLTKPGWLPKNSPWLAGNVAHVYTDANDDNTAQKSEEILPVKPGSFAYGFTPFQAPTGLCSTTYPCSWDPAVRNSWQKNRAQDAVQLFYFLGKFHDHLAANPIGFTRAAGNFEAVDDDAVQGESLDGANTANGLPDPQHVDNANMSTPPDGTPPRMQMYLFHTPGDETDPFVATSSANEADVVYHEYTHGLSNRLVVDANGVSTLGNVQAGSMGEAWSDFYAFDFLVAQGFYTDTPAPGNLRVGEYVGRNQDLIRTMPIDCPVGSAAKACAGTPFSGPGGYTYGDFGHVIGFPEVHADGEIWAQTLWDLRKALGSKTTESLVTRAMELSPANPSFLDERNAILQADRVVDNGRNAAKIWKTFAARGMGFFAGVLNGDDAEPVEDFSLPPAANTPRGAVTGTVTDNFGKPAAGVPVTFGGHASGFPGDYAAVSDAAGKYTITGILPGTYPKVSAGGAGYDRVVRTLSVPSRSITVNWSVRRDWAALGGGAKVVSADGTDYSQYGCGPAAAFDQSLGSSWVVDTTLEGGAAVPQGVVVQLPAGVNVSEIDIDPGAPCIGDPTSGTKGYRVETSADGKAWTVAATGSFAVADQGRLNPVSLTGGTAAVAFVRVTILSPQVDGDLATACASADLPAGCVYTSLAEVGVYGTTS
ncbi:M36 family metallopeptidase [Actinoplanes sp. CA-030573]|uniref:M36 family metallopeptidase n=1 Tax=Actinoplanes sp. CA-030573 TaxID=3239898 RepID=UPI003D8AFEC6